MTIASAIQAKQQQVADSYTAVSNKGGTLPATQNLTNLATTISTIPSGGSSPVITSLNVTPTTSAQTITAPSGTDGYSPVNVAAVTAAIDSDIKASNIKSGVSILGVTGTVTELNGETRTATLTSSAGNTFTPSSGKNAITSITVTPNNQARSVTPSTSSQTLSVNSGYSGNGTISVTAVTSSIDANIQAGNIKKDVQILGVTGTYEGSGGGGVGIPREIKNGVYQMPSGSFTFTFPSDATDIGTRALGYAFYGCTALTSVSFPSLTTISGTAAITYVFQGCTSLRTISFPSLATISGDNALYGAFRACTALTSVSFPSLATISGSQALVNAFSGCTGLTSVSFPKLTTSSFGSYKNQFQNMMSSTGDTKIHKIHFPSNLQSKISTLTGYPTFGGTSGYVTLAFDLPATS